MNDLVSKTGLQIALDISLRQITSHYVKNKIKGKK
jgi:hypothetical protein